MLEIPEYLCEECNDLVGSNRSTVLGPANTGRCDCCSAIVANFESPLNDGTIIQKGEQWKPQDSEDQYFSHTPTFRGRFMA